MHYLANGLLIKSENAAKSPKQSAKAVNEWIASLKRSENGLDFGCGKLRYARKLYGKCDSLTLVDSEKQLTRRQLIFNETTTIEKFVKRRWKRARALTDQQFIQDQQKYDVVLCANVLSAIPNFRVRSNVLRTILKAIKNGGGCMFVTQFRNSYFKNIAQSSNVTAYADGWILTTRYGSYYYGLIDKLKLEKLVVRHGYTVKESWIDGQSAFVFAGT